MSNDLDKVVDSLISEDQKLFESKSEHYVLDLAIEFGLSDVIAALAAICDHKADQMIDRRDASVSMEYKFLRSASDQLTGIAIKAEQLDL